MQTSRGKIKESLREFIKETGIRELYGDGIVYETRWIKKLKLLFVKSAKIQDEDAWGDNNGCEIEYKILDGVIYVQKVTYL